MRREPLSEPLREPLREHLPEPSRWRRLALTMLSVAATIVAAAAPAAATVPPVPTQGVAQCDAVVDGDCYVADAFEISTTSPGADYFGICRSNDTPDWGGCNVVMSTATGSTHTVSGGDLPSDGLRRAYYFRACNATGCTDWGANPEKYVYRDTSAPTAPGAITVPCVYEAGGQCWVTGSFTLSVAPATDGGSGVDAYKICRSHDAPSGFVGCQHYLTSAGGTSYTVSGSDLPSDGQHRSYWFHAVDAVGNDGPWSGPRYVRVDRHLPTVSATGTSETWVSGATATIQAADATAGAAANSGLARVHYKWNGPVDIDCNTGTPTFPGAVLDVPQGENTLYLCAQDHVGRTGFWSGTYRVDSEPPTAPGPTTVDCAHIDPVNGSCWVQGDFLASVTPATDAGTGVTAYRICRSEDTNGSFAGCQVDLTTTGGTSITVSGGHLPSDGFARSYWFQAQDAQGQWGPWNTPRYVRVDRHDPQVSATQSSDSWFTERSLLLSAADEGTGLESARYRWNTPSDPGCTQGTAFTTGETLTVPEGDHQLHLCARDRVGRVTTWTGNYRVDASPPTQDSLSVSHDEWSFGDGTSYQITAKASDTGSGVRGLRVLINHQGSNAANPRGNFSWRDESMGGPLWTADAMPCQGGGFASKRPDAFNPETVTLVGCLTSLSGTERTVTFTVRPEASFGAFPQNDIALWAIDFLNQQTGWLNFDLDFSTADLDPPVLMVLHDGYAFPQLGDLSWGAVDAGTGPVAKTLEVRNAAAAGSSALALDSSLPNVEIVGSDAFSISGSLQTRLEAQESDTFDVELDTSSAGTFEAELWIWHNDPLRPKPLILELDATVSGAEPVIDSIAPKKIAPGGVRTVTLRGQNLQDVVVAIPTEKYDAEDPDRVFPVVTNQTISADGTEVTLEIDATAPGIDGVYNVAALGTCADCIAAIDLRVAPPLTPVVDLYTPAEVSAGRVFSMVLTGTNLEGSTVAVSHPDVEVLDVESSEDEILSGILAVPFGVDPGGFQIEVHRPGAAIVTLPVSLVAEGEETRENYPALTDEKVAEARALGARLPAFFIQEPTPTPSLLARMGRGEAPEKFGSCELQVRRTIFNYTRIHVVPLDAVGKIDSRVLEAVGLGEVVRFGGLAVSFFAQFQLEFRFDFCDFTDFRICIFGEFGAEIIGFQGIVVTFQRCGGFPFSTHDTTTGGELTRMRLSSDGPCATLIQETDPDGGGTTFADGTGGAHFATISLDECCEQEVEVEVVADTFVEVPFYGLFGAEGTVPLTIVQPDESSCVAEEKELMLFLDANRDNDFAAATAQAVPIDSLSDIDRYLPCTNPDNDEPVSIDKQTQPEPEQRMNLVAAYVQRSADQVQIVPPPPGVTGITFELDDTRTSNFSGVAMNWPPFDPNPSTDPDFALPSLQTQTAFNAEHLAPVELTCLDYGGFTTVSATPNGATPETAELTIPKPQANPVGPPLPEIGWLPKGGGVRVDTSSMTARQDSDATPSVAVAGGPGPLRGDNLDAYAEYRGFIVDGELVRTNPDRKDIFVRNHLPMTRSLSSADGLGLEIHEVDEDEFYTVGDFRLIAFHDGEGFFPRAQSVIRLREDLGSPSSGDNGIQLGVTTGSLGRVDQTPTSTVFLGSHQDIVQNRRNPLFTVDSVYSWTVAHELAHAVDVCHRREDASGAATDEDTGDVLEDQVSCPDGGLLIPQSHVPGGLFFMHGGQALEKAKDFRFPGGMPSGYHPNSLDQVRLKPAQ